ncbi:hypothetical protein GUJ93_ZPchr0015g6739 [Zizania palustris]|uniref:Uncharacterized protein n=1 Tax=Zizania palustris TaxID=103762 RepID=A0A8J5SYK3_ZIZPA|nr:hypothetical protein GUJ93_ZPchr0015g6739 [Zizania palustris]
MAEAPQDILTPKPHLWSTTLRSPSFVQGLRMKHSMSTPSQCLSPSTLLDEPHLDHAFDAPRLLGPSSGHLRVSPSGAHFELLPSAEDLIPRLRSHSIRSTFEVPRLRGLVSEYLQPELHSALSAFTWHASTRGPTRTTFAATVTELPAPLASSLPLDPGLLDKIHRKPISSVAQLMMYYEEYARSEEGQLRRHATITPIWATEAKTHNARAPFLTPHRRPHSSHRSPSPEPSSILNDRTIVTADATPTSSTPPSPQKTARTPIADEDPNAFAAPARRWPQPNDLRHPQRYHHVPITVSFPFLGSNRTTVAHRRC